MKADGFPGAEEEGEGGELRGAWVNVDAEEVVGQDAAVISAASNSGCRLWCIAKSRSNPSCRMCPLPMLGSRRVKEDRDSEIGDVEVAPPISKFPISNLPIFPNVILPRLR